MGKNEWKTIIRENNDGKRINPIIAFLAFLLGAVVTAFVAVWRIRASKGKKRTKVSDDAVDRDYEAADREMKKLFSVLQRESERRMWGDPETRIAGGYGVSGANPANVQTQKVKPYIPRKRVSAKRILGRATAVAVAAALVVTGLYLAPYDRTGMPTVQAKSTFGGIKQVVQEHNSENPFVILDVVPGKAYYEINGVKYEFSLGTIGYLAPGQSPIQQDLARIFKGEGEGNSSLYPYSAREQLITAVKNSGFAEIEYKEAYLGIDGTDEGLRKNGWSRIFNSVDVDLSGGIVLPSTLNCPTGRLSAQVTLTPGGEYIFYSGDESLFASSAMSALSSGSYYTFAGNDGNWQLIFGEPGTAVSGYLPTEIDRGSIDELKGKGYSDATGLYAIGPDGYYMACGTIGNPLPVPTIEQEDSEEPTEQEETEEPTDPEKPDNPKKPENPDDPVTDPDDSETDPDDPVTDPDDPVTDPVDPPVDPVDPPTDPVDPPTDPVDPPTEEQPSDPPAEEQPADPPAEQGQQNDLMSVMRIAGTGAGWHLYVNMAVMEAETPEDPSTEEQPADPVNPPTEEQPTDPPAEEQPDDSPAQQQPADPPAQQQPTDPSAEQQQDSAVDTATYYVLEFTYFDYTGTEEQEGSLYQITSAKKLSAGETVPGDSYVLGKELLQGSLNKAAATAEATDAEPDAKFLYVGKGKGDYEITRPKKEQLVAELTGASLQEVLMQESDEQDDAEQNLQGNVLQAVGAVYDIEVLNAPVYIKCSSTSGSDGLRKFVFNSHPGQDNASNDFAIRVITASADEVTYEMVQTADLVYLEDGAGLGSDSDADTGKKIEKKYIGEEDGPGDIAESAILSLLYGAVEESKPVMVDYGIIQNPNNYAYGDSNYQKLAKAFLKKDLAAFYHAMEKSKDLVGSVMMNVGAESKEYPDKKDNDYHYVNRNVYVINNASLLGENFGNPMDKSEAEKGFTEVLAAIRAENVMLSDDEKISEDVSMAMAVQYIINYSLGLVGEYKDLSILELQPTANMKSDLHREANEEKERVVLYWQREDQDGGGQQILRSSRMIRTDVTVSSVAAFNSSYQDINADYNMIFIGLDGQRLYRDRDEDGELSAVYNDESLNGKVYHTGDRVAGRDDRYDANDITEQKKEALLDYLRAGYPIVVENDCFKGKSAKKAEEKDINTKYIGSDTQMYAFLKEAVSMGGSDQDGGESGIGIYTIEDVHSSALFAMQLNALRPKISLYTEQTQEDETEVVSDMIATEPVPDMPGIYRGTFDYRIASDRMGEDKTYRGNLERHLYLDLNYDGIYAPEEESAAYQHDETENGGRISVDFNEVNFGIVPWKLEVTDTDNRYRRASTQGCFTISGAEKEKIRVLQILDDTANVDANFQEQYDKKDDSMLAHYLRGAEALLNMNWKIETVTPDEFAKRLTKNANYLSLWDVVVLGFGESGNPGDAVTAAVNDFITAGGSVLVSSAGASTDKGRLGLSAAVLGQAEGQTYGKLGLYSDSKFRYDGILANMFYKRSGLLVDRVNDGAITRWPYEIGETASLEGTEISMPDYLLDIGTAQEEGQPYATAWFTLIDSNYAGGYSVSPRDGKNNYYVYSKGNVVYVGQSQYPYTYDRKTGDTPDGAGIDECRIFVNALMAAYNSGVHRAKVSIVAGFNGVNKVESVTVPFDVAFKDAGDTQGGILGDMVDVYFRFTDNNIAIDKATEVSFYYKNAGAGADQELLLPDGGINTADFTLFTSQIWAVENNRLVEVTGGGIVPGKVYRIKAPLLALQNGDDEMSQICVLLTNRYTRAGKSVEALSMDSVSLNRAQMFLLE